MAVTQLALPEGGCLEYERRQPENSVFYQLVLKNINTLYAEAEALSEWGYGYPKHVKREFDRYLSCGLLAAGFARIKCSTPGCRFERLVGYSCKGRCLCPSCVARRMADGAAHLADHVMPFAPYRQWTLSLPYRVRYRIGQDRQLLSRTLTLFLRTVFNWQRKTARRLGVKNPLVGAVTFCQRVGSLLQFTPHFHSWITDGTWSLTDKGTLDFHPLAPPEDQEVEKILYRTGVKVQALLAQEEPALLADQEASLAQSQAWAIQVPVPPVPLPMSEESEPPKKRRCAFIEGYSLHADLSVHKEERQKLERLLRYGLRPAFSQKRLQVTRSGKVRLKLRKPLRSGERVIHFAPLDFLRRLAAGIPPKRMNVVRFHGIFAPNAKVRPQVQALLQQELKSRRPPAPAAPEASLALQEATGDPDQPKQQEFDLFPPQQQKNGTPLCQEPELALRPEPLPPQYRRPWHELLKRVFGLEVLDCPRCGAKMKRISHIEDPAVIEKILRHLHLPTTVPEAAPARAPPQLLLEDAAFVDEMPEESFVQEADE